MSSINLSDDLINNFEDTIKSYVSFLFQEPCTGSSSAAASVSTSEQNATAVEQHMRRIFEAANEIESNLLQLKGLINQTLPEEQILENITDLRTTIERKETLIREFGQYLNDAIADFSVENTESLNGLLDELSRGTSNTTTATSGLANTDLVDSLSQAMTTGASSQSYIFTESIMDRRALCDSLIEWIKTFNLNREINQIGDLSDGRIIATCLADIDPNHFNEIWLHGISTETEDNCRVKMRNLNNIVRKMMDYYSKTVDQNFNEFRMPDLMMIVEDTNQIELSRLLQLVLGCAVTCDRKLYFINNILSMEGSIQHSLMTAIQELLKTEYQINNEDSSQLENQLKQALEDLNQVVKANEELKDRCHELNSQISALKEEKRKLTQDKIHLNERISQYENVVVTNSIFVNRTRNLEEENRLQQEEISRLESVLSDLKSQRKNMYDDYASLLQQNSELIALADGARNLKDEVDVLRCRCEKLSRLEPTMDLYKSKLEEMADLREELKTLEQTNTRLFEEKCQLEQENVQTQFLQTQLEYHKRTNQELLQKLNELQRITDRANFEKNQIEEKFRIISVEKTDLMNEVQSLRTRNVQLQHAHTENVQTESIATDSLTDSFDGLNIFNVPAEIREHLICLQHENKILKSRQQDKHSTEQILLLQNAYDQMREERNQLNNELWISNQKARELEAALRSNKLLLENRMETTEFVVSMNQIIKKYEEEFVEIRKYNDELQKQLMDAKNELIAKDEIISSKTNEMNEVVKRYTRSLEKARMILVEMQSRNVDSIVGKEVQALRQALHEKCRQLKECEKELEKYLIDTFPSGLAEDDL